MRVLTNLVVLAALVLPLAGAATGPTLALKIDNSNPMPWQALTGHVHLADASGAPLAGVPVTLTQSSELLAGQESSLAGVTDANGNWFWSFELDAKARLPGEHDLVATGANLTVAANFYVA